MTRDERADMTETQTEPLTEELLERLLASSSPEAYLDQAPTDDRSLSDYLMDLIDAHGVRRADVVRRSAVNSTFVYQIFAGERQVGRDNAIKIAFGIGCTLRETSGSCGTRASLSCGARTAATPSSSTASTRGSRCPSATTSCLGWANLRWCSARASTHGRRPDNALHGA